MKLNRRAASVRLVLAGAPLALWLLPVAAEAGLEWERTVQEFRSAPAQEKVTAAFRFKNTGAGPVTIASIRSSCGCTTASLAKRLYAPGEGGEIATEFRFGGRRGVQEKTITVVTADPDSATVDLALRVVIEEPLTIQPSLVFWRLGEKPAPKQIELRASTDRPVRITAVEAAGDGFKRSLKTVKDGEHYVLTIEPTATAARAHGVFTIKTEGASDSAATKVFAIVR